MYTRFITGGGGGKQIIEKLCNYLFYTANFIFYEMTWILGVIVKMFACTQQNWLLVLYANKNTIFVSHIEWGKYLALITRQLPLCILGICLCLFVIRFCIWSTFMRILASINFYVAVWIKYSNNCLQQTIMSPSRLV